MRPLCIAWFACAAVACAPARRYGLVESYRALPIPAPEFAMLDSYTAVIMPKPLQLHVSEQGSAWLLLVREAAGNVTEHVAVTYGVPTTEEVCRATVGTVLAILPGDPVRYAGATGLLVAHDGKRCFGEEGAPFLCTRRDAWRRAFPLPLQAITQHDQTPSDTTMGDWYARMLQRDGVRDANTTLTMEEYDAMVWKASIVKDAVNALPGTIGAGVAGTILGGPVSGLAVAGVTYLVSVPYRLIADDTGPEYGDTPMAASVAAALTDALRQCTERSSSALAARRVSDE